MMNMTQRLSRPVACLGFIAAIVAAASAQRDVVGGPLTGPTVVGAPFSADATTTLSQTLPDRTRIERRATARYYRDRAGRVRVEQRVAGADAINAGTGEQIRITIQPDPERGAVFTLDARTQIANVHSRDINGLTIGGGDSFALPLGGPRWRFLVFSRGERLRSLGAAGTEEPLGSHRIAGIDVTGRRITMTVPRGVFGNERPFDIVEERWESPELKLLIYSRSSDPRTGDIEYRLTNIQRVEQPPELFVVPADYTIQTTGDNGWTIVDYAERSPAVRAQARERE